MNPVLWAAIAAAVPLMIIMLIGLYLEGKHDKQPDKHKYPPSNHTTRVD